MPRPIKPRKIGYIPKNKLFVPHDIKGDLNDTILLLHDELEAIRLKDIEELNQNECADMMNISRQTFQLIIDSAHKKIATALVEGKPIKIDGGHYILSQYAHRCLKCGNMHQTDTLIDGNEHRRKRFCHKCKRI